MPRRSLGLLIEQWHPFAASVTAAALSLLCRSHDYFRAEWRPDFTIKCIDVAAVFLAYSLTALTVLPALNERSTFQRMRSVGLFKLVTSYLSSALSSAGAIIVLGLIEIASAKWFARHRFPALIFVSVWWAVLSFTLFAVVRASRILLKLIQSP